jgi:hypothetical protein
VAGGRGGRFPLPRGRGRGDAEALEFDDSIFDDEVG